MSGSQLKIEIRKLNLTQENAAKLLGITRQTLSVWFKYSELDDKILQLIESKLGVNLAIIPSVGESANSQEANFTFSNKLDFLQKENDQLQIRLTEKDEMISLLKEKILRLETDLAEFKKGSMTVLTAPTTNAG